MMMMMMMIMMMMVVMNDTEEENIYHVNQVKLVLLSSPYPYVCLLTSCLDTRPDIYEYPALLVLVQVLILSRLILLTLTSDAPEALLSSFVVQIVGNLHSLTQFEIYLGSPSVVCLFVCCFGLDKPKNSDQIYQSVYYHDWNPFNGKGVLRSHDLDHMIEITCDVMPSWHFLRI